MLDSGTGRKTQADCRSEWLPPIGGAGAKGWDSETGNSAKTTRPGSIIKGQYSNVMLIVMVAWWDKGGHTSPIPIVTCTRAIGGLLRTAP